MDKFFSRIKLKKVFGAIGILFLSIQFYRPLKNDMDLKPENDFLVISNAPKDIKMLIQNSCYDCHSNKTNYQWYDNIAPVSWWVDKNIERGKLSLNLSEWENADPQKRLSFLSASVFDIKKDRMPTQLYLKMHPSAILTKEEKGRIIAWINNIDRFSPYFDVNEH